MKLSKVLTLEPFEHDGKRYRCTGLNRSKNLEQFHKTKKVYVYKWMATILNLQTDKFEYWFFDFDETRYKIKS